MIRTIVYMSIVEFAVKSLAVVSLSLVLFGCAALQKACEPTPDGRAACQAPGIIKIPF
jgi:hypothetical protein